MLPSGLADDNNSDDGLGKVGLKAGRDLGLEDSSDDSVHEHMGWKNAKANPGSATSSAELVFVVGRTLGLG